MAGGRFKQIRDEVINDQRADQTVRELVRVAQERTIKLVASKIREAGYKGVAFDIEHMADEL